jgi:hypothetical protein
LFSSNESKFLEVKKNIKATRFSGGIFGAGTGRGATRKYRYEKGKLIFKNHLVDC